MSRCLVVAKIALLLIITGRAAHAGGDLADEIIGIRVIDQSFPADEFEYLPFHGDTGTQLLVMITSGEKQFVEILARESEITSLTGGELHDLLEARQMSSGSQPSFGTSPIGAYARFSKDRRRALIEISAPQSPAPGDAYLKLKGHLVAKLARGTKRAVRESVPLQPGPIDIDNYLIAIIGAGMKKNFSNEQQFTVDMRFTGESAEALESVQFLDRAGNEIKVEGPSWSTISGVTTVSYPLQREVANATLVFTFWVDPETRRIPLDATQTFGMHRGE